MEKINLLVIPGTSRLGSNTEKIAKHIAQTIQTKFEVACDFLDMSTVSLALTDDGSYKTQPEISKKLNDADGFIFVVPEYNHSFPGSLKIFLDSYYEEYARKAVGMVGVSNGVFGGARALISLTPVLRRLGMVMVHKDMFIGDSDNFFEAGGNVKDESFDKRLDVFVNDLVWLAQVLKQGKK